MKDKQTRNSALAFVIGLSAMTLLVAIALRPGSVPVEDIDSISIQKDGGTLTVSRDGNVSFQNGRDTVFDNWSVDKVNAFFGFYDENYDGDGDIIRAGDDVVSISKGGTSYVYVLSDDDELYDLGGDDAGDPDGGGDGNGGGDDGSGIDDYFVSPTPFPPGPGSGGTPTPTPYSGGGGSGECLYWRISYCVLANTPAPTPTPTPGPDANVIDSANCGEWVGQQFVPTIISNTLCITEPSPDP